LYNSNSMPSIPVKQKRRGRPATGSDPLVGVRIPSVLTDAIDRFRAEKSPPPTRSETIRAILQSWLTDRGYLKPEPEDS
jgi:hypothetical protein